MFTRDQWAQMSPKEKMEGLELRAKFHSKKAKATAEMKRIPKNGWNDFHKYHYARESDVKDMIREILNENKLSFSTDLVSRTETIVSTRNGQATKTDVTMSFTITDTETGYFEEYIHDGVTIDNSDKGIYKAYSNTIKYFLMDAFLIPTGDDVEKDNPETTPKPQKGPNPAPKNETGTNTSKPNGTSWKTILDAEKQLVAAAGTDQANVRAELKKVFGALPMYKELEPAKVELVLNQLNKWIDQYKHPQT
jgi:hypothetical protein